jgi:hypothetical protein
MQSHRVGFYPCCCGDIEEPRRFLAPYVDEILFCDLKQPANWDTVRDEPGLPKATFLKGDVRDIIGTLEDPLKVLFYRNDSGCEGGSSLHVVGKELLPQILQRFDPSGGWIFSDGSNGGKEFRSLLTEDWHARPSYGCEFRRANVPTILNRDGVPLSAVEVRPIPPAPAGTRPGWVPPRDNTFDSLDALWEFCTANNRLVPMPPQWNALYGILNNTRQKPSGGWEPSLPLVLGAWHHSMPIEKQLRFKEHLHWAEAQNQLPEITAFLRSLPEDQWCHFGEI